MYKKICFSTMADSIVLEPDSVSASNFTQNFFNDAVVDRRYTKTEMSQFHPTNGNDQDYLQVRQRLALT